MKVSSNIILRLCCYLSLAISFLPVVDFYCPWYITVIPVAIALFVTLQMNGNVYPLFVAAFAILGLWLLTYWVIYREVPIADNLINFFIAFIPCILAIQIGRTVDDKRFFKDYLRVLAIFVGITCVTTMIGLEMYPMASRELASGTAIYDTTKYTKANIGGYEFIYALVLLIPVFFWMIKHAKGFWKVVYLCVLVLDFLCIYASQYTIALVCAVIALIVVWMQKNKKVASIFTVALILFLVFNGLSVLSEVFYWASDVVEQEYTADRLLQIAQLLSGQKVDTETSSERIDHYTNQLETFLSSPVWGYNLIQHHENRISGHSLVLDMLGGAGVLGLSALVVLCRKLYTVAVNPNRKKTPAYVKAIWIMAAILAVLNPVIFSVVLTVVFMCCMCISQLDDSRLALSPEE